MYLEIDRRGVTIVRDGDSATLRCENDSSPLVKVVSKWYLCGDVMDGAKSKSYNT